MTDTATIDARTAQYRAILEAIATQGLDPAGASVVMDSSGKASIHATPYAEGVTSDHAFGILAALAGIESPDDMHRQDMFSHRPFSSYSAGSYVVFCGPHPDAREPGATAGTTSSTLGVMS